MLMLTGCGDNIAGIPIEAWADAQRAWRCRYDVQCGLLNDLETCERTNIGWYWTLPELVQAVQAGTVVWDSVAAYRCLQHEVSCDVTSDAHDLRCDSIVAGTLHDGETCHLGAECISSECWTEPCYGVCCVGYCVGDTPPVPGRIGEACRLSGCVEGYCDSSVCVPRLAEGAPCEDDAACNDGLACRKPPSSMDARCMTLPTTGERCTGRCALDGDRCGLSGVCTPGGTFGHVCVFDTDCSVLYRCGTEHYCVDAGAAVGESCLFSRRCAALDAYCDYDSNTCLPRYPIEPTDCSPLDPPPRPISSWSASMRTQ